MKIKYNTISLLPFIFFIAFMMFIVKDTDADRYMYIWHFAHPFDNSRIEIGFQYYMYLFKMLNIPPIYSTIITSLITYILLYKTLFKYTKIYWVELLFIVNIIIIGIYNYYLGTSIRMGLAFSLVLYSFFKIQEKNQKRYYILLFLSIFIHYGVSLFVIVFTFMRLFKLNSWKKNKIVILFATIFLLFGFNILISYLNLNSYYSMYLDGFGKTSRLVPFAMSLFMFILLTLYFSKQKNFNIYFVFYSIPFLIISFITGIYVIHKMLMPFLFIAIIEFINLYYKTIQKNISANIRILVLFVGNILSVLYALKMYNYL